MSGGGVRHRGDSHRSASAIRLSLTHIDHAFPPGVPLIRFSAAVGMVMAALKLTVKDLLLLR